METVPRERHGEDEGFLPAMDLELRAAKVQKMANLPYDITDNPTYCGWLMMIEIVRAVARGERDLALFCSPTGIGKTFIVRQVCRHQGIRDVPEGRPSDANALAKYLWANRKKPVVLLDEVDHLFRQEQSSNLLKVCNSRPRIVQHWTVEAARNEDLCTRGSAQYREYIPPTEFSLEDAARQIALSNRNYTDPDVIAELVQEHWHALVGRGLDPVWIPTDGNDGCDLFIHVHYMATEKGMLRALQFKYDEARAAIEFYVSNVHRLIDIHPRRLVMIAETIRANPIPDKRERALAPMLRDTDQRPKLILPRTWVSMDHTPNLFWPKQPPPPKHLRRSAHAAPSMRKPQLEPTEPTSDTVPAPSSTAAAMPSMEPELRSAAVEPAAQGIALPVTPEEPTPPEPPEPIAEPVVQPIKPDAAEIERVIPELVAREPAAEVADSSQQASEAIVANPSADVVALPVRWQPPKPDSVPLDRIDEPPAKPRKAAARVTRTKKQPEQPATDRDAIIQDIAKVCYPRIKRVCVIGSADSLKINGYNDRKVLFIGGEWPAHGEFPKEFLVEMLGRHDGHFVTREHTEYQRDKFNIAPVEWTITVGPEAKLQFVEACLAAKADRQQHVILDLIAGQPPLSVVREDFEWVLRRPFSSISLRTGVLMRVIVTGVWGDYFIILRGFSP